MRPLVDAAPDLLLDRGGGGRDLGDHGGRAGQPGQAHPGPPGQPAAHRQPQRDVHIAGCGPVADTPGQLARADQRAGRLVREGGRLGQQQLTERGEEPRGAPRDLPDPADRPADGTGVRVPRRHGSGEPPQPAEPVGMLAAGGDAQPPHDFIQAAERTKRVRFGRVTRGAVQGEAADRDVGPAPDDPRVSFRVAGRHARGRVPRGHRPGAGGGRCDLHRPGSVRPRAEHLTTHPAFAWLRVELGRLPLNTGMPARASVREPK